MNSVLEKRETVVDKLKLWVFGFFAFGIGLYTITTIYSFVTNPSVHAFFVVLIPAFLVWSFYKLSVEDWNAITLLLVVVAFAIAIYTAAALGAFDTPTYSNPDPSHGPDYPDSIGMIIFAVLIFLAALSTIVRIKGKDR